MRHIRGLLSVMWLVFPLCGAAAAQTTQPARPNILLIMTDQQTHTAMSCAGHPVIKTPNLDRLASQGVRITGAACATPFCSPTRASFRTGQWPHTHGIVKNVEPDKRFAREDRPARVRQARKPSGLSDSQVVMDNLLFDSGYGLQHLGKWHLGDLRNLRAFAKEKAGKQERAAYADWLAAQGDAVIDRQARPGETFLEEAGGEFVTEGVIKGSKTLQNSPEGKGETVVGRSAIAARAQFDGWLADNAIAWLRQHKDKPFMLTFSLVPPHAPWVVPDPFYSMYDPMKMVLPASYGNCPAEYRRTRATAMGEAMGETGIREYLRCYAGLVSMADAQIGRVLDALRELGLDENTVVIFTADHGDMQAAHGFMGKSVHAYFEEILRVPLIVRYPQHVPAGKTLDMQTNSVDLMPTILDYAGLPAPKGVQGRTLRPFLEGKLPPDDAPAFCERQLTGKQASRMIRTKDWKYAVYGDGRRELFHLSEDPGEVKNLAGDANAATKRQELEKQLKAWMERTSDPALAELFR